MSKNTRRETTDAALKEAKLKLGIAKKKVENMSKEPEQRHPSVAWRSEQIQAEDRLREQEDKSG
jgi:hypothetical protein